MGEEGTGISEPMKKVRMIIDILMVVLLPLLMAYSMIGENVHEVLGICMFAFFDFGESRVRFLLDYAAIMVLVADIAHWIQTLEAEKISAVRYAM